MNQRQRELRRAAAQDFLKSLNELEEVLEPEDNYSSELASVSECGGASNSDSNTPPLNDMSAFDDAVADIEEHLEKNDEKL